MNTKVRFAILPAFAPQHFAQLWPFRRAFAQGGGYHVLNTFTLGGDGGWDYLNLDPASG